MKKRMFKLCLSGISLLILMSVCLAMVFYRAAGCFSLFEDTAVAAQLLTFGSGSLSGEPQDETAAVMLPMTADSGETVAPTERTAKVEHSGKSYPVVETNISSGNMSYDNFSVKNTTSYSPDFEEIISSELPFELSDDHTVQVLIYHTHTCESYMTEDSEVYYEDFYPRSTDGSQGVIAVGDRIAAMLKSHGIGVIHDKTLHDYPSYEGSYGRSWDTISKYLEKYSRIKVTIDIHRDSMTASDGTKYKPTFTYQDKKAAQIMIMTGCSADADFSFWDENLIFAAKLQQRCESMYPGMTRPLYFGEFTYNMNFNNGSLLIEVGTDANTVEEACLSGEFLGNALSSVLQKG